MLKVQNLVKIHHALHEGADSVTLDGIEHKFQQPKNKGYKFLDHEGFRFQKQNPKKAGSYSERARNGARITWGMRDGAKWAHIEGIRGKEISNFEDLIL